MVTGAYETRTKIVCTIGPQSKESSVLRQMIREGMDVARINLSHGTHRDAREMAASVRQAADAEGATVALLADLQGPKLRVGELPQPMELRAGDWVALTSGTGNGGHHVIPVPHAELLAGAVVGRRWLLDEGAIELAVREVRPGTVIGQIIRGGTLTSRKGIHAPGSTRDVAALTDKDREDARLAVSLGADYIALSFVQSADDMTALRQWIDRWPGGAEVSILAKIEKREGLENLERILDVSDAVMVARGDLGLEIPPQEVPIRQKEMVRLCRRMGVPVIVATQMLESMISSPRPTRAEASDVANAVLDGADAIMLSGETAVGRYPVEAVRMMREISGMAEKDLRSAYPADDEAGSPRVADAVSRATARVASDVQARLIASITASGYTARRVARERPSQPIVALTHDERVGRQLALVWGVAPLTMAPYEDADEMIERSIRALIDAGYAIEGDTVVLTAGLPVGGRGTTNLLKVHRI